MKDANDLAQVQGAGGLRRAFDHAPVQSMSADNDALPAAIGAHSEPIGEPSPLVGLRGERPAADAEGPTPKRSVSPAPKSSPVVGTAADLRSKTFPPVSYIAPGYIAEGLTMLAGRPKIGKSWLMLEVGLAVAGAGPCLGSIECELGDVLYLALEDNERRLQARITKLLGYARKEWPRAFHYATQWPRAGAGGLDAIRSWINGAKNPRLIVIDVLAGFRTRSNGKDGLYEADYNAIKELQSIALEIGLAIVVVHHLRKDIGGIDPFEKVSGTLGLSAAADTVLILDRDSNGTSLYGRGRDIEEIEVAVEFDASTCRWTIKGPVGQIRLSDQRCAILRALEEAAAALTPTEIARALDESPANVKQLLFKMAKDNEVVKEGRGRYRARPPITSVTSITDEILSSDDNGLGESKNGNRRVGRPITSPAQGYRVIEVIGTEGACDSL